MVALARSFSSFLQNLPTIVKGRRMNPTIIDTLIEGKPIDTLCSSKLVERIEFEAKIVLVRRKEVTCMRTPFMI